MRKKTLQRILWHFCDQVLKKNLKLTSKISLIMQKKSFQIFQKEFFSNSTSFLLKKSYIPSNIAPFNYPGTLRVIGPGSGPGPGNGKSQKTGSGPGTPLLGISGYPGNSLPGPTLILTAAGAKISVREIPSFWIQQLATLQKEFSHVFFIL